MLLYTMNEDQSFDEGAYIESLDTMPIRLGQEEIDLINETIEDGRPYLLTWNMFGSKMTSLLTP